MRSPRSAPRSATPLRPLLATVALLLPVAALAWLPVADGADGAEPAPNPDRILRGRALVIEHACGGCHGGGSNPAAENWLVGMTTPEQEFRIGACGPDAGDEPCFLTRPRNLTPDNLTGMGRFSERQIFNALRYGLRPGETEDVEITSVVPGEGNHPASPKYLAPPMPWPAWRHIPDEDLWAIAAYLKQGLKPVRNRVPDSEGPPDFWAGGYTVERMGSYPAAPFPTAQEVEPPASVDRDQVLRGRHVVIQHDCGGCHGGGPNPEADGYLAGITDPSGDFLIGPCAMDPGAEPCFRTRPANLTPHATAGIGRYADRELFNALRYGLKPGEHPDVEITGAPGDDGFPETPHYLAQGMPWESWRHMSDDDLEALIAYLRHGLKPVDNVVPASEGPDDFWASYYTAEKIGTWPAPPFPTENEVELR